MGIKRRRRVCTAYSSLGDVTDIRRKSPRRAPGKVHLKECRVLLVRLSAECLATMLHSGGCTAAGGPGIKEKSCKILSGAGDRIALKGSGVMALHAMSNRSSRVVDHSLVTVVKPAVALTIMAGSGAYLARQHEVAADDLALPTSGAAAVASLLSHATIAASSSYSHDDQSEHSGSSCTDMLPLPVCFRGQSDDRNDNDDRHGTASSNRWQQQQQHAQLTIRGTADRPIQAAAGATGDTAGLLLAGTTTDSTCVFEPDSSSRSSSSSGNSSVASSSSNSCNSISPDDCLFIRSDWTADSLVTGVPTAHCTATASSHPALHGKCPASAPCIPCSESESASNVTAAVAVSDDATTTAGITSQFVGSVLPLQLVGCPLPDPSLGPSPLTLTQSLPPTLSHAGSPAAAEFSHVLNDLVIVQLEQGDVKRGAAALRWPLRPASRPAPSVLRQLLINVLVTSPAGHGSGDGCSSSRDAGCNGRDSLAAASIAEPSTVSLSLLDLEAVRVALLTALELHPPALAAELPFTAADVMNLFSAASTAAAAASGDRLWWQQCLLAADIAVQYLERQLRVCISATMRRAHLRSGVAASGLAAAAPPAVQLWFGLHTDGRVRLWELADMMVIVTQRAAVDGDKSEYTAELARLLGRVLGLLVDSADDSHALADALADRLCLLFRQYRHGRRTVADDASNCRGQRTGYRCCSFVDNLPALVQHRASEILLQLWYVDNGCPLPLQRLPMSTAANRGAGHGRGVIGCRRVDDLCWVATIRCCALSAAAKLEPAVMAMPGWPSADAVVSGGSRDDSEDGGRMREAVVSSSCSNSTCSITCDISSPGCSNRSYSCLSLRNPDELCHLLAVHSSSATAVYHGDLNIPAKPQRAAIGFGGQAGGYSLPGDAACSRALVENARAATRLLGERLRLASASVAASTAEDLWRLDAQLELVSLLQSPCHHRCSCCRGQWRSGVTANGTHVVDLLSTCRQSTSEVQLDPADYQYHI